MWWSSVAKAELEAARLENSTRCAVGDVHARFSPRVKLLVARLGVGGDGDETVSSAERADIDRAQRFDSARARATVGSRARREAAVASNAPSEELARF